MISIDRRITVHRLWHTVWTQITVVTCAFSAGCTCKFTLHGRTDLAVGGVKFQPKHHAGFRVLLRPASMTQCTGALRSTADETHKTPAHNLLPHSAPKQGLLNVAFSFKNKMHSSCVCVCVCCSRKNLPPRCNAAQTGCIDSVAGGR